MANTSSAKKMVRKIAARTSMCQSRRSRMRTFVKSVESAVARGEYTEAMAKLQYAQPEIMRAAQKGVVDRKAASRKLSRLSKRIKMLRPEGAVAVAGS